jgi:glucoamylase
VKTHLTDYINFAKVCQDAAPGDQAKFTIDGRPFEGWPLQSDGPALQTLALMRVLPLVAAPAQDTARAIADANTQFLLGAFNYETTSLWEEVKGNSFFARSVQLKCFRELKTQTLGMNAPAQLDDAIGWLSDALDEHWDGSQYLTFNPAASKASPGDYDPNMDVVSASIYGAIDVTDAKLLATAAKIRRQWTDDPQLRYPINESDRALRLGPLGPLLGRYPGDYYDGVSNSTGEGHPWALCTCNFAQLYYELATAIEDEKAIPDDPIAEPFFSDVQVSPRTPPAEAATALRAAGDQMLRALIYHSDNLELSEQFDRASGFEKSVSNLTWSYAAFLSALRAR